MPDRFLKITQVHCMKEIKTSSLGYTSTLIKIDKTDLSDKDMDAFEQLLMKQGYGVEHQSGYAFTWAFLIRWY
jgi:hypothetical protein